MARRPKRWRAAVVSIALGGAAVTAHPPATARARSKTSTARPRSPTTTRAQPITTTVTAATVSVSRPPCIARGDVEAWPLARQAAQVLMIAVNADDLGYARTMVGELKVGGLLIRGNTPTMGDDLNNLRTLADPAPMLAADEEGGRAQRLRDALGVMPSAQRMASTLTTTKVRALAKEHALKMRSLGLTMNLAPDVDLTDDNASSIGNRSFSADADVTIAYASAFAQGMADGGVFPVIKHFPGHGRATGDSHKLEPDTPPLDDLRTTDLRPFLAIPRRVDVGVMVGHLRVPGIDDLPATVSSSLITGVLRGELGFRGLIVTDALSMLPIRARYSTPGAAVHALEAGADLLLFDEEKAVEPIIGGLVDAASDPAVAKQLVDAVMEVLEAKGYSDCVAPPQAR